LKKSSGKSLWH